MPEAKYFVATFIPDQMVRLLLKTRSKKLLIVNLSNMYVWEHMRSGKNETERGGISLRMPKPHRTRPGEQLASDKKSGLELAPCAD